MSSKNCAKNFHACQWERDIFFFLALLFLLLNIVQITFTHRAKIYRLLRRGADQIPNPRDDEEPIIGIRD